MPRWWQKLRAHGAIRPSANLGIPRKKSGPPLNGPWKLQKKALTLLEILIALVILGAVVGPAYSILAGSRRTMIAARELSTAVSLAGSFMTALRQADVLALPEGAALADDDLVLLLGFDRLGIATAPAGFTRRVNLRRQPASQGSRPLVFAEVIVDWKGPGAGKVFSYRLSGLLSGTLP